MKFLLIFIPLFFISCSTTKTLNIKEKYSFNVFHKKIKEKESKSFISKFNIDTNNTVLLAGFLNFKKNKNYLNGFIKMTIYNKYISYDSIPIINCENNSSKLYKKIIFKKDILNNIKKEIIINKDKFCIIIPENIKEGINNEYKRIIKENKTNKTK